MLPGSCQCERKEPISRESPAMSADHRCPPGTKPAQGSVRRPAIAGSWYPGEPAALERALDGYLSKAAEPAEPAPIALVAPHAGYRYSGPTAAYAYKTLGKRAYRRVYLIGPAHRAQVDGISLPDHAFYETPLGRVPIDRAVADKLLASPLFSSHPEAHRREHCLEIQLPFLQHVLPKPFAIVPMLVGHLSRAEVDQAAAELRALVGADDLVVASSDFTHYGSNFGYVPFQSEVPAELEKLAMTAYASIERRDVDGLFAHKQKTGDTICGFLPIAVVLAMLPDDASATLLRYDTSGRITGDYHSSVSYLSIALRGSPWRGTPPDKPHSPGCVPTTGAASTGTELSAAEKQTAHDIAQRSVEQWVRHGIRFDPRNSDLLLGPGLQKERGVFVTLKKHGQLRGCIGNILPRGPLHQGIAGRARDAAANDNRFSPVTADELAELDIEISVLTEPKPVASAAEIVLGRDGIILRKGGKQAVFLPQVAPEQGWNLEQTLTHLATKARLDPDGWREGAKTETFQALVF